MSPSSEMKIPSPASPERRLDRLAAVAGTAYLFLLPWNLPLRPPVYLHDLLGPVLLLCLALRIRAAGRFRAPDAILGVYLLAAGLATVVHFRAAADLYEWAVFAYMGVLYGFFSRFRLPARVRFGLGLGILTAGLAFMVFQRLTGVRTTYQVYEGSTLGFMAERFFFTFPHPNLAASFYALPVVLVLSVPGVRAWAGRPRRLVLFLAAAGVLLFPLVLTVSRHLLLSGALVLGFLVSVCRRKAWRPRLVFGVALGCLAGVFALFYLTILFPFFPLRRTAPFFNHATFGMYTIHQVVYAKIVFRGIAEFFLGVGKSGVKELYPLLVDREAVRAILSQYRQAFLAPSFAAYMDAHNEYLNQAADFGVPAMLCGVGFWVSTVREAWRSRLANRDLLLFFVLGVLLACLWDDLWSKRWIWIALGILIASNETSSATPAEPPVSRGRDALSPNPERS